MKKGFNYECEAFRKTTFNDFKYNTVVPYLLSVFSTPEDTAAVDFLAFKAFETFRKSKPVKLLYDYCGSPF
jgi:hypothetical protein